MVGQTIFNTPCHLLGNINTVMTILYHIKNLQMFNYDHYWLSIEQLCTDQHIVSSLNSTQVGQLRSWYRLSPLVGWNWTSTHLLSYPLSCLVSSYCQMYCHMLTLARVQIQIMMRVVSLSQQWNWEVSC